MLWPSLARLTLCWEKWTANAMQALINFVIFIWVPLVCALVIVAVLPLAAGYIVLMERKVMADLNIGLLFVVGIGALGIFGIVLGGWSSNSHYSLLGALRSAAQLVSYETAAGLAIVGALLLAGTLSTRGIVLAQSDTGWWFIFVVP